MFKISELARNYLLSLNIEYTSDDHTVRANAL